MAKASLLEMVQEILSDMTSDAVNSIFDTEEALQVATIIKRTFLNLVNDRLWPSNRALIKLIPYSDSAHPTHMKLPESAQEIDWVKYNIAGVGEAANYVTISWKPPAEFVNLALSRDAADPRVETVLEPSGVHLFIRNDCAPSYYTTFDDTTLVFDSYDSTVDSTLQASKIHVYGISEPSWEMRDDFIPDMPAKYFPYLVNEAKSTAFVKIKEVFSQKDEQNASRQKSWLAQNKRRADRQHLYPNYGRRSPGGGRYSRHGYRNNHFIG
jgi:hypothetical protein